MYYMCASTVFILCISNTLSGLVDSAKQLLDAMEERMRELVALNDQVSHSNLFVVFLVYLFNFIYLFHLIR